MERSVVVVATCEQPPIMRVRAAQTAITIADYFRSGGAHVLFLLDSLTRLAMAQRDLGLALGEPPTARGYTPSVFQLMATTLERLGNADGGSITGIITVLVDGDDLDEPISDAARALLDGHIVLDRGLAERGQFPAISIAGSISRVARDVTTDSHQAAARKIRTILATHAEMEDLIRIGAYTKGSSPPVDRAVELLPVLTAFLRQEVNERTPFADTSRTMERIAAAWPF
jgi:flagellum-specific ATP synthase